MAELTTGADTQGTGTAQIDSILPVIISSVGNTNFIVGTHRVVWFDPTTGSQTVTLPTPTAVNHGCIAEIMRIENGGNSVEILGIINNHTNGVVLGLPNQNIRFMSDFVSGTWRMMTKAPSQFATFQRTTSETFDVTTTYADYNEWESILFGTAGALECNADDTNIDVLSFESVNQMGYRVDFSMTFTASNGKNCAARLIFDGDVGGIQVIEQKGIIGQGGGNFVSLSVNGPYAITETGAFRIQLTGEINNTWTILEAKLDVSRIVV